MSGGDWFARGVVNPAGEIMWCLLRVSASEMQKIDIEVMATASGDMMTFPNERAAEAACRAMNRPATVH